MQATALTDAPVMEAGELRERLERREPLFVLDVRPEAEAREWWIPGSTRVDAYHGLWSGDGRALFQAPIPDLVPTVTVCARGNTSLIAAHLLRQRGVRAYSLAGGMKAWSTAWNTADVSPAGGGPSILQVRRTGKGCLSYMIASRGEAAVVDASVAPEVYVGLARDRGWTITSVLETHVHADHLWRGLDLARLTGARLHLPRQDRATFAAEPVEDGTRIRVGAAEILALHTPGHTFESTTYRVGDHALITGDTLFLASVGRPDLEAGPEETRERARLLRSSLHRLAALEPHLLVLPGHTSTPVDFDGQPLAARLDDVRRRMDWLDLGEAEFVARIVKRVPPAPANHQLIVRLNETGLGAWADIAELEAGANRCAAL